MNKMKKLLNSIHGRKQCKKFLILQWGSKRSIIQNVSDIDNPILIVDNQYLMNLDERGLVL